MNLKHIVFVIIAVFIITGCASVPKEVVELSYLVGEDLEAVHASYRLLIQTHYQGLREEALDFIQNEWTPVFLKDFMNRADLVNVVKDSEPMEVLDYVQLWAEAAIRKIEDKKKELINPIDEDEKAILNSVDEAFANLIRANATITAHLNSIREVNEVNDEVLGMMDLKDLRDTINDNLVKSSEELKRALEEIEKLEMQVEDVKEKKNQSSIN